MERDPVCIERAMEQVKREFHVAWDGYRMAAQNAEEEAAAMRDPSAAAGIAAERSAAPLKLMEGALAQAQAMRDQLATLLEEVEQTGPDVASEFGEGSTEHEELLRRGEEYARIDADVATFVEKAEGILQAPGAG